MCHKVESLTIVFVRLVPLVMRLVMMSAGNRDLLHRQ